MSISQPTNRLRADDLYPSRIFPAPSMQVRQDPVVYPGDFKSPLDRTQIASYIQNGFLFIESLFSEEEALLFRNELEKLKRAKTLKSREEAITERNSGELRSLFRIHKLHPLFEKLASDERIVKIAEFILGSKVYIHQSRLNFKPGFSGKEFYWHSDFETWHVEDGMPRMRALSVSISLMENNEFNGPLMLIPSSHHAYVACVGDTPDDHYKQSLKQQDYGVPDEASLRFLENKGGIAAPKGPAGSVTFFDCNVMHGSNSNISPYPRCNIFLVYNSVENRPVTPFCGKRPRPEFIAARANPESIEAKKNHYAGFMDKQRERKYAEN